jgi:hypothetical protein
MWAQMYAPINPNVDVKRRSWYQILETIRQAMHNFKKGHGNITSRDEITANIPATCGTCSALQTQGCVVGGNTTQVLTSATSMQ